MLTIRLGKYEIVLKWRCTECGACNPDQVMFCQWCGK